MSRKEGKTITVKLGTSILTAGTGSLSKRHILEIVRVLADLHSRGHRIVVVTSGAQAAGRDALGHPRLGRGEGLRRRVHRLRGRGVLPLSRRKRPPRRGDGRRGLLDDRRDLTNEK